MLDGIERVLTHLSAPSNHVDHPRLHDARQRNPAMLHLTPKYHYSKEIRASPRVVRMRIGRDSDSAETDVPYPGPL
jgi:hypothetical protein